MRALAVCGVVICLAAPGVAAQKTPVRVEFQIEEPSYASLFTPDELRRVERDAAGLIASSVRDRLPVLDLTGADSAAYRLVVTLDLRGGSQANPLQADRGFYVRLVTPEGETEPTWWSLFRSASQTTEGLGGRPGVSIERSFLDLVRLAVARANVDPLVRDHLSRVPIVEEGHIWPPPPGDFFGWVATRERDDLCLALESDLRVVVLVPSQFSANARPREYDARVEDDFDPAVVFGSERPPGFEFRRGFVLRPEPADQSGLDQLSTPQARVVGFYLVHYEPDRSLCEPLPSPAEAELGMGEGS